MSSRDEVRQNPVLWWGMLIAFLVIPVVVGGLAWSTVFLMWTPEPGTLSSLEWLGLAIALGWAVTLALGIGVVVLLACATLWGWLMRRFVHPNERAFYASLSEDEAALPADAWEDTP